MGVANGMATPKCTSGVSWNHTQTYLAIGVVRPSSLVELGVAKSPPNGQRWVAETTHGQLGVTWPPSFRDLRVVKPHQMAMGWFDPSRPIIRGCLATPFGQIGVVGHPQIVLGWFRPPPRSTIVCVWCWGGGVASHPLWPNGGHLKWPWVDQSPPKFYFPFFFFFNFTHKVFLEVYGLKHHVWCTWLIFHPNKQNTLTDWLNYHNLVVCGVRVSLFKL